MSGEPRIRTANLGDAEAIADLVLRAFEAQCELYNDWTLPPMSETAETVAAAMQDGIVLVTEIKGRIVGSVRGRLRDDNIVDIGRLVVEPELQCRGLGRELARTLEARYPQASLFEIFTGHRSAGSLHLYESLGYVRVREIPLYEGLSLIYLHKPGPAHP